MFGNVARDVPVGPIVLPRRVLPRLVLPRLVLPRLVLPRLVLPRLVQVLADNGVTLA